MGHHGCSHKHSMNTTNKITPIDLITDDTRRVQAKGGFREMDQATPACAQLT